MVLEGSRLTTTRTGYHGLKYASWLPRSGFVALIGIEFE
jgi:hypothetical protein